MSSPGEVEKQRRALREAAAKRREAAPVAVQKKPKARLTEKDVVEIKDAPPKKGPGRPAGPERVAILIKVPPLMIGRLERTQAKRKLPTRNEAIVALLDEGAEK